MNPVLTNTTLRELPEYLIQDYLNGRASETERKIVESLMNLPENSEKLKFASENLLTKPGDSRVERLMSIAQMYSVPASRELHEDQDVEPAAGQIWSISQFLNGAPRNSYLPIAQTQYIFILTNPVSLSEVLEKQPTGLRLAVDDQFVEYLPVSMHTEFANQYDLIFPSENSILDVEFMIMTEINSTTLCSNLANYFGTLNEEETEKLLNLYFYTQKMGHDYELLSNTLTGSEHYNPESSIVEYKKIEFQNSQIISEPVEDMMAYLEGLGVVVVSKQIYDRQKYSLAASTVTVMVADIEPEERYFLYRDTRISIAVNEYKEHGYYFNVVVTKEACPALFTFKVTSRSENKMVLEIPENKPDEYFFSFYKDFKSGIFTIEITSVGKELLSADFSITIDGQ